MWNQISFNIIVLPINQRIPNDFILAKKILNSRFIKKNIYINIQLYSI